MTKGEFMFKKAFLLGLSLTLAACSPRRDTLCTVQTMQQCEPSIYFAFDTTDMDRNGPQNLDWVAQKLKDQPNRIVYLTGHSDLDGEKNYNRALSLRRSKAIGNELVARGVDSKRIKLRAKGSTEPVTEDLMQQKLNRRVDITFGDI